MFKCKYVPAMITNHIIHLSITYIETHVSTLHLLTPTLKMISKTFSKIVFKYGCMQLITYK